jgi:UDP-N-acetylglucosamine enolpyruvyl transferase
LIAGAFQGNSITVRSAQASHLECLLELLRRSGAEVLCSDLAITVNGRELIGTDLITEPFPVFPPISRHR